VPFFLAGWRGYWHHQGKITIAQRFAQSLVVFAGDLEERALLCFAEIHLEQDLVPSSLVV
jgi:hypothetical protein